ncbi:MAG: phage holin family protein [Myxococcota bacterium]
MSLVHGLTTILLQGLVVFATAKVVPGFKVERYGTAVLVAVVYSALTWLLKGVLVFFSIPLIIVTLGGFMLVLNAFLLWLTNKLVPSVEIKGFVPLFLSAILITIGNLVVHHVVG